jgi:hypothetical protein
MDKITSKSSIRPELQSVYFWPDKMVATDSFHILEVKKEIGVDSPRLLKTKGFKGRGTVSIDERNVVNDGDKLIQGELVEAEYPDYERACFSEAEPKFSMRVNAKLLAELLAEVDAQTGSPLHKIRLDFFDTNKPLIITAEPGNHRDKPEVSVRAALSPVMS